MALTKVSYSLITGAPVNVLDYGAVGNGVADDTAAIVAAYDATPAGGTLVFPATSTNPTPYLLTSTWTISKQLNVVFEGAIGGSFPGVYIKKASTLNATAISITAQGTKITGGGVYGVAGNGGNGIDVLANSVVLDNVFVHECGQDGIRVGSSTQNVNCNSFVFINPYCSGNDRHGIYISDSFAASVNANAGTIIAPRLIGNTSDGIQVEVAYSNTIISPLTEGNGGAGIRAGFQCYGLTIVGGDVAENNTAGDIIRDVGSKCVEILGSRYVNPSNSDLYIDITTAHINSSIGSTGIGFGVPAIGELITTPFYKGGIAFARATSEGRGILYLCSDGAADKNDFDLNDAKMSVSYAGEINALASFYPANPNKTSQSASAIFAGTGAPSNSNGNNGDYYFRSDGTTPGDPRIYFKVSGTWTAFTTL